MQIEKNKYTVSIILTTYNRKKYLPRAIKSILKQSFKNYEVIIVDDGSDDNSEKIIFSYIKKYSNFKYIRHSNRKNPLSVNTGFLMATGKYITLLDSDDEYNKEHLKLRVDFMNKNKSVDLLHSPAELIGKEKDMYLPDARNKKKLIHINDCIIGATLFGKRDVFINLKGFKDKYSADFDFYKRAIKSGYNVVKFESATYIYYRNLPDSVTNKLKQRK
ncbi:MAG: glycosyltransferase family 2 protein [Bacteroidetes bacterium]|nr:glycosyltransferase family 2 protein [Bacteroidota bacterium]